MFARMLVALAAIFTLSTAHAEDAKPTVTDAVVYATMAKVGVGFFTLTAPKNDTLEALSSPCCKAVELHRNEKINGMMTMRRIGELSLKKNSPLAIQEGSAGGEHLMLIGLSAPLKEGDSVPVTLTFKKAGAVTVDFPVKARQAKTSTEDEAAPAADETHDHDHHH
jgi:copper(I)-binding protein